MRHINYAAAAAKKSIYDRAVRLSDSLLFGALRTQITHGAPFFLIIIIFCIEQKKLKYSEFFADAEG